jgi:hypothetical protein
MSEPLLKYREPVAAQDVLTEAVPARLHTEGSGLNLARAALFGVNLDNVADIVELLRSYRGGRSNSLIMGGPMGWSWYSTLDDDHHGELSKTNAHRHTDLANIGIDDHHARDHATRHHSGGADALALGSIAGSLSDAQHGSITQANAHAHSHLSGVGVNDHHARDHASTHLIGGADALSVGAPVNIGTSNAAGSATNFARRDHVHAHPSGLDANLHHNRQHSVVSTSDHTGRITKAWMEWTADKLLKGAGTGANPTEIDVPVDVSATAGDELILSADTERFTALTSYTKLKEIRLGKAGTLRIKFDAMGDGFRARIYRNGAAVGTERTLTVSYQTFSEDISGWSVGDLCQLYARTAY